MKFELSHDSIARQIYEKSSADAKARRKVQSLVERALERRRERGVLLTQDDLDEIRPYQGQINFSEAQEALIRDSRRHLATRLRRRRLLVAATILMLAVLSAYALVQSYNARQALAQFKQEQAAKEAAEAEKQAEQLRRIQREATLYMEADEYWFALEKWKEALAIDSTNTEVRQQMLLCQQHLNQ